MAEMYLGNESGGFDLVGTTNIKNIDFEEAKISKEDYENLSEEEKKSGVYLVTGLDDTVDGGGRADLISYDNTNSGLGSTNVQGAIDELNSNINKNQKILYSGSAIYSGTIDLTDSIDNYDYFKIFHSKGIIVEISDFTSLQSNYLIFVCMHGLGKINSYRYEVSKESTVQLSISNPYYIDETTPSAKSTTEGIVKIVGYKL